MDKLDIQEKLWGGIFGVVAIVAAIGEMFANGVNTASILGMVKDVAGTVVVVIVMVAVAKLIVPQRHVLAFEDRLMNALREWEKANSTMIVKSSDDDKTKKYGFSMRTDIQDFYRAVPQTKNIGWFVRLPQITKENYEKENVTIAFHLNKGTFFEGVTLSPDELETQFTKLNSLFCGFINAKYGMLLSAGGSKTDITVNFKSPIQSDEDIRNLIDLLNSMLQAYLASANVKI